MKFIRIRSSEVGSQWKFIETQASSEKLSKSRTKNKKLLESQFFNLFQKLGLKNAKLKIEVLENDKFNENGKNSVIFYFSANKGVDYKKLNKVALKLS